MRPGLPRRPLLGTKRAARTQQQETVVGISPCVGSVHTAESVGGRVTLKTAWGGAHAAPYGASTSLSPLPSGCSQVLGPESLVDTERLWPAGVSPACMCVGEGSLCLSLCLLFSWALPDSPPASSSSSSFSVLSVRSCLRLHDIHKSDDCAVLLSSLLWGLAPFMSWFYFWD